MAAPFKLLTVSCIQRINKMPTAIKKLPHTKVLGNRISMEAKRVMAPLMTTTLRPKPHWANISSISGLALSIF